MKENFRRPSRLHVRELKVDHITCQMRRHSVTSAHNTQQTHTEKVLSKIKLSLTQQEMEDVANCVPMAVERAIHKLQRRVQQKEQPRCAPPSSASSHRSGSAHERHHHERAAPHGGYMDEETGMHARANVREVDLHAYGNVSGPGGLQNRSVSVCLSVYLSVCLSV